MNTNKKGQVGIILIIAAIIIIVGLSAFFIIRGSHSTGNVIANNTENGITGNTIAGNNNTNTGVTNINASINQNSSNSNITSTSSGGSAPNACFINGLPCNSASVTTSVVPILTSITIATPATNLIYTVGQSLDISGLTINETYNDGSTDIIIPTLSEITGNTNTTGIQILTITDGSQTITYNVNVIDIIPSVTDAANRLITLQNINGAWDWVVTDAPGPTSTTYLNIAGVTAEGLLNAYNLTGNLTYLTAAENTGNYLISNYGSDGSLSTILNSGSNTNINAFNIKFLYDLGSISGNNVYTTEANVLMDKVIAAYPTGSSLLSEDEAYRGTSNGEGIIVWDLYNYVNDANLDNNSTWANSLANALNTNSPLNIADTSDPTYILGLSGLVMVGNSSAETALISAQQQSGANAGSWYDADGQVQDTAYATMALMNVGDAKDAMNGTIWLMNNQNYDSIVGGWYDTMGIPVNNNEISEVNSEAIQAF